MMLQHHSNPEGVEYRLPRVEPADVTHPRTSRTRGRHAPADVTHPWTSRTRGRHAPADVTHPRTSRTRGRHAPADVTHPRTSRTRGRHATADVTDLPEDEIIHNPKNVINPFTARIKNPNVNPPNNSFEYRFRK